MFVGGEHFGVGRILLRAFVMVLELVLIKLFAITISVFDFIIVVDGVIHFNFTIVKLSIGKMFATDGSSGENRWCVGAQGVACARA